MKTDPTGWLLAGSPSLRYWTLRDILGRSDGSPEMVKAGEEIINDPEVQRVFSQIEANGGLFWSTPDGNIRGPGRFSTIYCLSFLADAGLTCQHSLIAQACDFVFRYQSKNGAFEIDNESFPCYTGIILGFLIKFGLGRDERVIKTINWLLQRQRWDGGWYCERDAPVGEGLEKVESCPWAVLNTLSAFSELEELRTSKQVIPAVEFLLKHWETKKPIPDVRRGRFGIGPRWERIRFPFFGYDLLNYATVLSQYDYALTDPRFKAVAELLLSKQVEQGWWVIEWTHPGWEEFEFSREGSPSRWATLAALRVISDLPP